MGGKADGDSDNGYLWYDKRNNEWRDYKNSNMGDSAIVYYWTDADPEAWVNKDPPSIVLEKRKKHPEHPAVLDAWNDVEEAIKRYETVKALCEK
jgi:hypothetical protein